MISANGPSTPKEALQRLARASGLNVKDVLALAPNNDPFNSGSDTDIKMAQWFASIFNEHGFPRGTHLRRMHYKISSLKGAVYQHDGTPYENSESCWNYLQRASKQARYLGLVDAEAFTDHRNPEPMILAVDPASPEEPTWYVEELGLWLLPRINTQLNVHMDVPGIYVDGYNYRAGEQPYHLEVWVEKNTMNDVLLPVCREHRANLCTSLGFQSVTAAVRLLERLKVLFEMGHPARIFYISDFDPSGDCMPVAVARQLQFWLWRANVEGDVKLRPLALTHDQVVQYDLPRKPIKESDGRRTSFEDRRGEGAVELDALEAIHPGELARVVDSTLAHYRDTTLEERLDEAAYEARAEAESEWEEATEEISERVKELCTKAQKIADKYAPKLRRLNQQLQDELAPISEEMASLREEVEQVVNEAANGLCVDLPERPEPDIEPPDESDWLFDSTRSYGEQLQYYQAHREGSEP